MSNTTLYGQDLPKVIMLSDIYDPDVDFGSSENTSKIIPVVGSLLVDGTNVYVVTAVDATTHKTTYKPLTVEESEDYKRILEYGNTFYALFYSTVTITDYTGTKITLTRLAVDDKLTFYGDHITNYDIAKKLADGTEVPISRYFDSQGKPGGTICAIAGTTDNKKCVSCYSYETLSDGTEYTLRYYDSAGNKLGYFKIISTAASTLTDEDRDANPIVSMKVRSNQMDSTGNIFLYRNQNVDELTLYPVVVSADGSEEYVTIDNRFCFLYNKEAISTKIPGVSYTLLLKYFIEDTTSAAASSKFVSLEFKVYIVEAVTNPILKVTIGPEYDLTTNQWSLKALAYSTDRLKGPKTVTPTFTGFDPTQLNVKQSVNTEVQQILPTGEVATYQRAFNIEVRDPSTNKINPFLISDVDMPSRVYGDNTPPKIAPRLVYGEHSSGSTGYFIPAVYNESSYATKAECFIANFYTESNPPKLEGEASAPVPTHFTIRTMNNESSTLLLSPVKVEDFEKILSLICDVSPTQWVNSTVIVEFWRENDSDYDVLFGAPVRIVAAE